MKYVYKVFLIGVLLISFKSFSQQQLPPVIEWQKCLGGSKIDRANTIIRTLDNGYLVVGLSFSNDGNVTGHHGSTDSSDAWVVKLDRFGNLQWQRSVGGTGNDFFMHAIQAPNGDFLCVGTSESNNGDITGAKKYQDLLICRLSSSGSIIWTKVYGGTEDDKAQVIRKAIDGGYIVAGDAVSNDNDVSGNHGFADMWILKIDDNGVLQWQKSVGTMESDFVTDLQVASDNTYIISGYRRNRTGSGCIGSPVYSSYEEAYVKIGQNGNLVWEKYSTFPCGNPGSSAYAAAIFEMPSKQLRVVGHVINVTTENDGTWREWQINAANGNKLATYLPPNFSQQLIQNISRSPDGTAPNSVILLSDTSRLSVVQTRGGNFAPGAQGTLTRVRDSFPGPGITLVYQQKYGGSNTDVFRSIDQVSESEYIVAGYSNSNNGDVSGNHGDFDVWVVKFSTLNKIKGRVFVDNNGNGIKDAGENYFSGVRIQSSKPGKVVATVTDNNGAFLNNVDTGNYTTTVQLLKPFYNINPPTKSSSFATFNNKDSFDFALVPIAGKKDLRITVTALGPVRPGFNVDYRIDYVNDGTDPVSNVVVRMLKPWNMSFVSAMPAQTSIVSDTVYWNLGSLAPLSTGSIFFRLKADPPPNLNNGEQVQVMVFIDPLAGDESPADNRDSTLRPVTGSYDPNDKQENANGTLLPQQVASGKSLLYTVRFQNTGNDTAFNVIVRDTLDAKLDFSSIEMLAASHNYHLGIKDGRLLTWTFTDIKLVDSHQNEPASHGYIIYRIKPSATLAIGDTIRNSAYIYFDFNLPIKTNTHLTIVKAVVIPQPSVGGIAADYCSNQGIQRGKINNLPAAGSGITVTAKLDGNNLSIAADSTFSFDVSTLAAGTHLVEVSFSNGSETKTSSVNFNVTIAVSPDVNVTSNIATVVNMTDPVIVTAVNAGGGGSTPLYTFGKDRNFSNLWQAESANNILNIAPTALQVGDNWIYVRMKTSATCFTTQQNIDSIKIVVQLPAPNQPVINGLQTSYCSNDAVQKGKLGNPPAAGSGTTVSVKLDGNILSVAADSSFSFDPGTLATGNHVIEVTYSNSTAIKTTTVNFAVTAAVVPNVNVTALGGSVPGLNDPIVITAINANGGGTTPLYAFASDRNFTRILQAEGAANSLTLNPTALRLGDNWIYVRMKTSLSCYVTQTAIDSILITRFGATGLVDPDFPNQKISPNPNPFRSRLVIHGFSNTKSYTIILYNQQGRILNRTRVVNKTTVTLYVPGYAAGTYMLNVYDETKKRMIGTVEVVKQ